MPNTTSNIISPQEQNLEVLKLLLNTRPENENHQDIMDNANYTIIMSVIKEINKDGLDIEGHEQFQPKYILAGNVLFNLFYYKIKKINLDQLKPELKTIFEKGEFYGKEYSKTVKNRRNYESENYNFMFHLYLFIACNTVIPEFTQKFRWDLCENGDKIKAILEMDSTDLQTHLEGLDFNVAPRDFFSKLIPDQENIPPISNRL